MRPTTSERLLYRQWREDDLPAIEAMNANPHIMEFVAGSLSQERTRQSLSFVASHFQAHGFGQCVAEERVTGRLAGLGGLMHVNFLDPANSPVEFSWRFLPEFWGKGFAHEAMRAAFDSGFNELGLDEIVAYASTRNERSIRLMGRAGLPPDLDRPFLHPMLPPDHPTQPYVAGCLRAADFAARAASH